MNHVTPRYVCLAVAYLICAFMVGGACGALVATVVAMLFEVAGTGSLTGEVARVIMGTCAFVGVVMFVGDKMAEVRALRKHNDELVEYKRGVQWPRNQG
jgi:hypothetical protein